MDTLTGNPAFARAAIAATIARRDRRPLLRFITCGSVDDGKSTLIGRLLHETQLIAEDEARRLAADSRRHGTQGEAIDFALLVDGLDAEREQGITIDVAHRYFGSGRRQFIVADCPGHEQYTRNMATGASTADLAIVLVDARKGLTAQTRRHSHIVALLGIRQVVLAVNKMDLRDYDEAVFRAIEAEYRALADHIGIATVQAIPLSALAGENLVTASSKTPWYDGPALLEVLEEAPAADEQVEGSFRLPVQWVCRPDAGFRGYAGTLTAGEVRPGDAVQVLPSGRRTRVERIVTADGDLAIARAGQAVTLTLADEVDVARGDVLAAASDPPALADRFTADLVWMDEEPLVVGRAAWLKLGTRTLPARVQSIRHRIEVSDGSAVAADTLGFNGIGRVEIVLDEAIAIEAYARHRALGAFVLIDRISHATLGGGMVREIAPRPVDVRRQALAFDRSERARRLGQRPACLWFTGLSGAGKSTLAARVERRLAELGLHSYALDGDNLRHGLNRDLGFSAADRSENVRRIAEVARLMVDAGLVVLVSCISPTREGRAAARALFEPSEFHEIHVDTPLAVAEARDPKGLYAKARAGALPGFTGIDAPYEVPEAPELRLDTAGADPEELAGRIVALLLGAG
jgi:bifunctional enzyme CysN/CysC